MDWIQIKGEFESGALDNATVDTLRSYLHHLETKPYSHNRDIERVTQNLRTRIAILDATQQRLEAKAQHARESRKTNRALLLALLSLLVSIVALIVSYKAWQSPKSPSPASPTPAAPAQMPPSPAAQPGPPSVTPTNAAPNDAHQQRRRKQGKQEQQTQQQIGHESKLVRVPGASSNVLHGSLLLFVCRHQNSFGPRKELGAKKQQQAVSLPT